VRHVAAQVRDAQGPAHPLDVGVEGEHGQVLMQLEHRGFLRGRGAALAAPSWSLSFAYLMTQARMPCSAAHLLDTRVGEALEQVGVRVHGSSFGSGLGGAQGCRVWAVPRGGGLVGFVEVGSGAARADEARAVRPSE
jgi:hypothetical protein